MRTLSQFKDSDSDGYRYEGTWYQDAHSVVLSGMLGFCGCGMPDAAARYVRDVLTHVDHLKGMDFKDPTNYPKWEARGKEIGSDGVLYFTYYVLDEKGYLEHGGSVPGWLTDRGHELLALLRELPEET